VQVLIDAFEQLLNVSENPSSHTAESIAIAWSDAIDSYSQFAEDELGNSLSGGVDKESLKNKLKTAFAYYENGGTDANYRCFSAVTNALKAYWQSAMFEFSIVPGDGQPGSGISNTVSYTGGDFSSSESWKYTELEGAIELGNRIHARTLTVKTTINYFTPLGNPASKVLSIQ
jgi:hypothetical protein